MSEIGISAATERSCPACEKPRRTAPVGIQGGFQWLRCRVCGSRFVSRMPESAELDAVYAGYYNEGNLKLPSFVERRLAEIVGEFEPFRDNGRLLDVGYGAGGLLDAAAKAGWECWGTEVAPDALDVGRERGWHVRAGDLPDLDLPAAAFDVVCLVEVVEHLPVPMTYIRKAVQLLRPGGLLYVTTPNGASLNSRLLKSSWSTFAAPEHLQLFSPRGLSTALAAAGLRNSRIRAEGLNPLELVRALRSLRSRELQAAPRPAGGTASGRVAAAYALNERFTSRPALRLVKRLLNLILTGTGLGDGLKGFARKPLARHS